MKYTIEEMIDRDFDARDPFEEERNEIYREIRDRAYWLAKHLDYDEEEAALEDITFIQQKLEEAKSWISKTT